MGHVTVSVNQKSLSRVYGIHRNLVGCFAVSHTASASFPHFFSVDVKSQRAAVLKAKEKL